jgi:hypothetical protein
MAQDQTKTVPEKDLAREAGNVAKPGGPAQDVPAHGNQNRDTRGAPVTIERHPAPETKS